MSGAGRLGRDAEHAESGAYDAASSPANNAAWPPCECPKTSTLLLGGGGLQTACRAGRVEHTPPLALADQKRVQAGSAEPLVVGGGDHIARVEERLHPG